MLRLKRCEHCSRPFEPQLSGRMAVLCRPCTMDCDDAYIVIRRFLKENHLTNVTMEEKDYIADATGIPGIFVYYLFREGKFGIEDSIRPRLCKSCHKALSDDEREFCSHCYMSLSKNLFHSMKDSHTDKPYGSDPHKYGLGKHL